jgi:Dyp-type peroxidase family
MSSILSTKEIEAFDPALDDVFANLQGYVLKHHGREHAAHVFLTFSPGKVLEVKEFIKEYAEKHVTSTRKQLYDTDVYKRTGVSGGVFSTFYLSASGYTYLGESLSGFSNEFQAGMKTRGSVTNDPPVPTWELGFRGDIHCMILVAHDNEDVLGSHLVEFREDLSSIATIQTIEYGHVIRNQNGDGIEHFGYVDGISQPTFFKEESNHFKESHNIPARPQQWDPTVALSQVLVDDPKTSSPNAFGSYFVFRKLEQNVQGFKNAEKALGEAIFGANADDDLKERAGAMIVGRFEDGTPVTLEPEAGMIGSGFYNNFDYRDDANGGKCPFHAHIRKSNPRHDASGSIANKAHMMARRGIPFGHREVSPALDPENELLPKDGVGLLFMSFQASLANQFEFIQQFWVNSSDFSKHGTGLDLIIGQGTNIPQHYPHTYGNPASATTHSFDSFVKMKGGEYFFLPSMAYLKSL